MVKGGEEGDLDAKAFPFCTAEAQQDSPHFPACLSEGLCRAASPEGSLHPECVALRGKGSQAGRRGHRGDSVTGVKQSRQQQTLWRQSLSTQNWQGTPVSASPRPSRCLGVTRKLWVEIRSSRDQSVTQEQLPRTLPIIPPLCHFSNMSLRKVKSEKKDWDHKTAK